MKCEHCGREIANPNAQFCPVCGTAVKKPEVKSCPHCGKEYGPDYHFCEVCGRKLVSGRAAPSRPVPVPGGNGVPTVMTLKGITHYKGEPTFSIGGTVGNLEITAESLRFHGTWGAIGGILNKKNLEFPMRDIVDVHQGTYLGGYRTVVIKLKNQEAHSFAPPLPGENKAVKDAIDIIRHCM